MTFVNFCWFIILFEFKLLLLIMSEVKPHNLQGRAPKFQKTSNPFAISNTADVKFGSGVETSEHKLETRMKQIQFGKNTIGYDNYLAAIPKEKRRHPSVHPPTPDIHADISKRTFEGQVKAWRRSLHLWDNSEVRPDLQPRPPKSQQSESTIPSLGKRKSGDMEDLKLSNGNKKEKVEISSKNNTQDLEEGETLPVSATVLIGEETQDGYNSNEEVFEDEDVL